MNAVHHYLPAPNQKPKIICSENPKLTRENSQNELFTGFVFKIINDQQYGMLYYTRIYSGSLQNKSNVMNASKNLQEKI